MNRTAVISGTTQGIGRVTTLELARAGWKVVMLCRNVEAARGVRDQILDSVPGSAIEIVELDLSRLGSVRTCAAEVRERVDRIDCLINNAGLVSTRHALSADGYELTFAVNHLGPFLLTKLLLDRLAPAGRIVNVASRAHFRGTLDLGRVVDRAVRYRPAAAYAQSKLANVMHTFALARRLHATHVTANCLHPGVVATNLLPRWLRVVKPLISPVIFDSVRGARTSLHLVLGAQLAATSGAYFDEHQVIQPASLQARNPGLQEALWSASERWVAAAD